MRERKVLLIVLTVFGCLAALGWAAARAASKVIAEADKAHAAEEGERAIPQLVESAPAAEKAKAVGQPKTEPLWFYGHSTDGMGRERWNAIVDSVNTVEFHFPYDGAQRAFLNIRAKGTELTGVIFQIQRGQFLCNSYYEGCRPVNVRFDQGPIRRFPASPPTDYNTTVVFLDDVGDFIAGMRKAKTVSIEATFYHEGAQAFTFPVAGFRW